MIISILFDFSGPCQTFPRGIRQFLPTPVKNSGKKSSVVFQIRSICPIVENCHSNRLISFDYFCHNFDTRSSFLPVLAHELYIDLTDMSALNLNRYHPSLLEQDVGKHGRLGSEFQREVLKDEESFITYLNSFDLKDQFVSEDGKLTLKNLPPDAETFLLLLHRRLSDRQIQNLIYAPPRQGSGLFASSRRYTDQIFLATSKEASAPQQGQATRSTVPTNPEQSGNAFSTRQPVDPETLRRERELTDLLMDLRDDFFDAILGAGTDETKLESVFVRLEETMARYKHPDLKQQFNTLVMDDPRAGKYDGTTSIEDILSRELSGRKLGRMTALASLRDSHELLDASFKAMPSYK